MKIFRRIIMTKTVILQETSDKINYIAWHQIHIKGSGGEIIPQSLVPSPHLCYLLFAL